MAADDTARSPELDQVRRLLFPGLSADEGWRKVEAALAGAADPERLQRIEVLAGEALEPWAPASGGGARGPRPPAE